jgi:ABC-type polysaccharide/polyol phosphate export permease
MINLFRDPVYNGVLPHPNIIITSSIIALITLAFGWGYFAKQSDTFAYRA